MTDRLELVAADVSDNYFSICQMVKKIKTSRLPQSILATAISVARHLLDKLLFSVLFF
jgi:hypothetical protein